jgi:hypothetical protein
VERWDGRFQNGNCHRRLQLPAALPLCRLNGPGLRTKSAKYRARPSGTTPLKPKDGLSGPPAFYAHGKRGLAHVSLSTVGSMLTVWAARPERMAL